MARGKKTSEQKKEEVKALLLVNPDISEPDISKHTGLPKATVHYLKKDIIESEPDTFESIRAQKKEEFIKEAWKVVTKTMLTLDTKVDMLLKDPESLSKANIRDIAVALGTIYDKQALASGEPTIISDRKEPTPELVKELETKVQRLKELTGS